MTEGRSLGEAIRLRRIELGMSQEELAERIGLDVHQSDVSRLERGKITFPRLERLQQIASALGLTLGALLVEAGWFTEEENPDLPPHTVREPSIDVPIVIADDEPISLDALAAILRDSGCSVTTAYDFASLMDAIKLSLPGLVIVDIALPSLDLPVLRRVLANLEPEPAIIFMGSGLPNEDVDEPYLEKPIDSRQLLLFIDSLSKHENPICPPPPLDRNKFFG